MLNNHRKNTNKPLYGIVLAFLVPILLAHILFHSGYGRNHSNSKGTLLSPPIQIDTHTGDHWQIATLETPDEHSLKYQTLTKRWQALGKDQKRVLLTAIQAYPQHTKALPSWERHPIDQSIIYRLQQAKSKNQHACQIFIINPKNNAILCYDEHNSLKDIDLDLRKLLKLSRT